MKFEDNELLTRVANEAPMGDFLRQYWAPAIRSGALEAGGSPLRVRLFGTEYVAFRSPNGEVGFIDEWCPHRRVSLALARNEDHGLRCIFHGWKMDRSGKVIDAPCEDARRRDAFCAAIRTNRYHCKEAAGIVWVYTGTGNPPPFPDFEFMALADDQVYARRAIVRYNWLQGLEAHIDASHVPILHHGSLTRSSSKVEKHQRESLGLLLSDTVPRLEIEETAYGFREGQIRSLDEDRKSLRVREVVLPFFTFIPGPPGRQCSARVSVPIDDETTAEWYILYDTNGPLSPEAISGMFAGTSDDPDDFAADLGTRENLWGQDRAAMAEGHFTGLTRNLSFEDFIVQESMGRRVDRTKEQLGGADMLIVKVRRLLLSAVRATQQGGGAPWRTGFDYRAIRAQAAIIHAGEDWRRYAYRREEADPAPH